MALNALITNIIVRKQEVTFKKSSTLNGHENWLLESKENIVKLEFSIYSVTLPKIVHFFIFSYIFCSARDLNCIFFVSLVNEIIKNDCRANKYHVKAVACTKLVNNTQKGL